MRGLMAVLSITTCSVNANSKNNISTNEKDVHGQGESGKYNVGEPISIRKSSYLLVLTTPLRSVGKIGFRRTSVDPHGCEAAYPHLA